FYQFKGRGAVTVLMFFFSAIFFGLIHWNNFNGNVVEMIPYMMMGAWFSLLYLYSKNIWVSITTHFLFDVMTPVASIFMLIITIIQH
ncbi:CPBP family intramembrane glutamic endopeptidase, partial [Paucilactobacillus nenjiangensis]